MTKDKNTKTSKTHNSRHSGQKRRRTTSDDNPTPAKRAKTSEEEAKELNPQVFNEEALANLRIYNELKTVYEEEGINQTAHQFLKRISHKKIAENPNLNKVPLMQQLSTA